MALTLLVVALSLPGFALLASTVITLARMDRLPPPTLQSWPSLSIVVPACDEAEGVEAATRSLLALDYPELELIAVDDRSRDGTGGILDALAAEDERLRVEHVRRLPEGWLGKVHALQVGVASAGGDWLLFIDADAHLAPDGLRRAVSYCEARSLDFLSLVPHIRPAGLLGDAAFAFSQTTLGLARPWRISDPESEAIAATGAFMLARASVFRRSPGFEWLRLEVADDFGLCLLMKKAGGRCALQNGSDLVSLTWYASFTELARRMQKNFFAIVARCSPLRAALLAGVLALVGLLPLAALLPLPLWATSLALSSTLALALAALAASLATGRGALPALLSPLGPLLIAYAVARAGWLGWRMGGIEWRGQRYPSDAINAGRRVFL